MKPASTRGDFERVRFLEAVLHSAIDYAIIALDLDGHIIEWTEGAQRILGWTSDEMLGRHLSVFFTPDDVAAGLPEAEMRGARESGARQRRAVAPASGRHALSSRLAR